MTFCDNVTCNVSSLSLLLESAIVTIIQLIILSLSHVEGAQVMLGGKCNRM